VTAPTSGELILGGDSIYNGSPKQFQTLHREKIGFIFQFSNLIPFPTNYGPAVASFEMSCEVGGGQQARGITDSWKEIGTPCESFVNPLHPGMWATGHRQPHVTLKTLTR